MSSPQAETMKATLADFDAAMVAAAAPSLCPSSPIWALFISGRVFRYSTAARASSAKSAVVEVA